MFVGGTLDNVHHCDGLQLTFVLLPTTRSGAGAIGLTPTPALTALTHLSSSLLGRKTLQDISIPVQSVRGKLLGNSATLHLTAVNPGQQHDHHEPEPVKESNFSTVSKVQLTAKTEPGDCRKFAPAGK